jgi:L-ribulokinase
MSKYTIGIDFGTESGRAVLVEVESGHEVATAVYPYSNGVIDEKLPESGIPLEPDWALQDPEDYIRVFQNTIPQVLKQSVVDAGDVIGLGIDFTACTMLPTKMDGTPLCVLPEWRAAPHAWVKLWKHHAAQPEADKINAIARQMGQTWLNRYGGKISSEWFFSKALQILDEAPQVYAAADRLIEAADWVVWQLTDVETRNSCIRITSQTPTIRTDKRAWQRGLNMSLICTPSELDDGLRSLNFSQIQNSMYVAVI